MLAGSDHVFSACEVDPAFGAGVEVEVEGAGEDAVFLSLHQNHPGVSQELVAAGLVAEVETGAVGGGLVVVVIDGAGVAFAADELEEEEEEVVVDVVVVVGSLHPNQPGVSHVEVVVVLVDVVVVSSLVVVVVSSRQPHHPGVSQVDVRVVEVVELVEEVVVVVVSEPLLSKYFQL